MFNDLSLIEAFELYDEIRKNLLTLNMLFGEAGVECIADALHVYARGGHARETSGFDEDFAHLFTLAYRERTGYDLKPEFSCLTDWDGATSSRRNKHESDD